MKIFNIREESLKSLTDINAYLGQIEIKGQNNIALMNTTMILLQKVFRFLEEDNRTEEVKDEKITIDNTKCDEKEGECKT
jgi:hypothetical protein